MHHNNKPNSFNNSKIPHQKYSAVFKNRKISEVRDDSAMSSQVSRIGRMHSYRFGCNSLGQTTAFCEAEED